MSGDNEKQELNQEARPPETAAGTPVQAPAAQEPEAQPVSRPEAAAPQEAPAEEPSGDEEQTMESLLEEQNAFHTKLQNREVVWVKVVQASPDQVLVDIGEKSEGVIAASEFPKDSQPKVGRRVPAVLVRRGRGEQATVLSTEKAKWRLGWDQAVKAFEEKSRVRGKVTSAIKGGFLVDVSGVTGFMPSSLSDLHPVRKPDSMVGTGVRCRIIELNKEKGQFILSRRAVLEEEASKRRSKLLKELKPGNVRIGRINRVHQHGLTVDIGGLEGLVHISDISWRDPEMARAKFGRGQKVRVRVLKIDDETGKVSLGIKQLGPHPAEMIRRKFPLKSVVRGKVVEILKEGVRIKLTKGDSAYCPVQELPTEGGDPTRLRHDRRENLPPVWPKEGDSVTAIVTGVHNPTIEVAVSIRRYDAIQERKRVAQYLKGAPPLTLGQLLNPEGE